jgi:hypothetical protein
LADDPAACTVIDVTSSKMFSPSTCNFFVPFAQKDARFASAARRRAVSLPRAQKISREIKA